MTRFALSALAFVAMIVSASATQISPKLYAIGYDKRGFALDLSTSSATALMFTILDKPCAGPVLVRFVVTTAIDRDSAVTVTLRARCMETGGYLNACPVGDLMYPFGNVAYLMGNPALRRETHSYEFVIENQTRGGWKYELMLNADPSGRKRYVEGRTMVVEAYPGLQ